MESKEKEKMSTKDKISFGTCVAGFLLAWLLIYIDFFTPPIGNITDQSLYVLGQVLIYCASILGVTAYFTSEIKRFKSEIKSEIKK